MNQSEWDFPNNGFYPKMNDVLIIKALIPKNTPKTYFGEMLKWTTWVIIKVFSFGRSNDSLWFVDKLCTTETTADNAIFQPS